MCRPAAKHTWPWNWNDENAPAAVAAARSVCAERFVAFGCAGQASRLRPVPLEAMARGRPAVATGRGGSAEYLRDGENCVLFGAGDPEALAAAVRQLGADPGLRARLRAGGLDTAPRHTAERFDEAVERHLLEVAGAAAAPAAQTAHA